MNKTEATNQILKAYYEDFKSNGANVFLCDKVEDSIFNKAVNKYAFGLKKEDAIVLIDTSILQSGGAGYIFTDSKMYCSITLGKPAKVWYDEIDDIEIKIEKKSKSLFIRFKDETYLTIYESMFEIDTLYNCLIELVALENLISSNNFELDYKKFVKKYFASETAGRHVGTYGIVNKLFEEEKFHASQGHGFAAERANNLVDNLTGKKAKLVGDNNVKNGADRLIVDKNGNEIYIQSKYCKTGQICVNECFDKKTGEFRYFDDSGNPMKIEVPSDKYDEAVKAMEDKIKNGKVKNVSNPEDARNIIKKGHFKYGQAVNLAKAGTVESLTYDSYTGIVVCASAFGVSFAITFATSIWNEDSYDIALRNSASVGIRVGGTAFLTTVLAGQLTKAGLNSLLVGSSEYIIHLIGPKAAAALINAFRSGANIYGAAAMKSAAKLLRGNVITSVAIFVISSSFDIVAILRSRISPQQLFKNMITNGATIIAGGIGWAIGTAVGTIIQPGFGTKLGGALAAVGFGTTVGKITNKITGKYIEDDAVELMKIIEKVLKEEAEEYLLTKNEGEKIVDSLTATLSGKFLRDMFASKDREEFARNALIPIIEKQVEKRKHIDMPNKSSIYDVTIELLEDIYDNIDSKEVLSNEN